MQAERVVNFRGNPIVSQMLLEFIARITTYGELIVDVMKAKRCDRRFDGRDQTALLEKFTVTIGASLPTGRPRIQMTQLDAQNRRLESVEPTVGAKDVVIVLLLAAVDPEHAEAFSHFIVIRSNHSAIARAAQILRGEEAEGSEVSDGPYVLVAVTGTDSLRGILDYGEAAITRDFRNWLHVRRKTEQMDRHNRPRLRRDGGFNQSGIDVVRLGVDVNKDGSCAKLG